MTHRTTDRKKSAAESWEAHKPDECRLRLHGAEPTSSRLIRVTVAVFFEVRGLDRRRQTFSGWFHRWRRLDLATACRRTQEKCCCLAAIYFRSARRDCCVPLTIMRLRSFLAACRATLSFLLDRRRTQHWVRYGAFRTAGKRTLSAGESWAATSWMPGRVALDVGNKWSPLLLDPR